MKDQPTPLKQLSLSDLTFDQLRLAQVTCDFISRAQLRRHMQEWLRSGDFHHLVTLNPEMVVLAEQNRDFRAAVTRADLRVPDGAGLVWAQWYIRSQFWALIPSLLAFAFRVVERIPGVELVYDVAALCEETKQPLYLLGGTMTQVAGAARKLREQFPGLTVHVSQDHAVDLEGPNSVLEDIRRSAPAALLVAYGAPKQTLWIERNRTQLPSVRVAVGVGGAFAILSEERPRAPWVFRRFNVEWLWRLLLEPRRLPRIWRAVVEFPRLVRDQKRLQAG